MNRDGKSNCTFELWAQWPENSEIEETESLTVLSLPKDTMQQEQAPSTKHIFSMTLKCSFWVFNITDKVCKQHFQSGLPQQSL